VTNSLGTPLSLAVPNLDNRLKLLTSHQTTAKVKYFVLTPILSRALALNTRQ